MSNEIAALIGVAPDRLPFQADILDTKYIAFKRVFQEQVLTLFDQDVQIFMTSMEWGIPLIGAEIVIELRETYPALRLLSQISFEYQGGYRPAKHQEMFKRVIEGSDEVEMFHERYYGSLEKDRDRNIAERADIILAVFPKDKKPARTGHAARTINYALECGKRVVGIDPDTLEIYTQDDIPLPKNFIRRDEKPKRKCGRTRRE